MAFDISKLTMGEIAFAEDQTNERFIDMVGNGEPSARGLAAIAMLLKRRDQLTKGEAPNFSWNQAQELTFDDVQALLAPDGVDEVEAPKEPQPKPSKTSKATTKKA